MANWFTKSLETSESSSQPTMPEVAESPPDVQEVVSVEVEHTNPSTELIEQEASIETKSLALLSQAHHAIAEARSLDELKGIRDKAEAARKYAQAAGLGLEIQNYAAEVKLRAERRAGSLLAKLKLHGGDRREETSNDRLTLEDVGVTKDQSSRWQLTAAVPEKEFDRYVSRTREESGEVTTAGLIRIANELRAKQKKRQKGAEAEAIDNCTVVPSLDELLAAGNKFACVYVDPPWTGGEDNLHFVNALNELHVELLVEDNAHLHMWASDDSLFAAKQAIENWGFEFKGCLLCLNSNGRPGNYWVEAHEYLLLGVRGGLPLMERKLNSWMRSDRDQAGIPSSRVRKLIERVSPGPYLDLFGRQRASGWTIYSTLLESASETTNEGEPTKNETEGEGGVEATSA